MEFQNLTPHNINVVDSEGNEVVSIPPSGEVARLAVDSVQVDTINGVDIYRSEFGEVEGLPEPKEGAMYIVSALVRTGFPNRSDLLSPGTLVRDEEGKPVGCQGLVTN